MERGEAVSAWVEKVVIPTYGTGVPEKNPIFLQKRVYQGSSGAVYPHPVVEKIYDTKEDREYTAVFLENEYLRIMILPELGGRVQRAFDKIRNRDFIYYNHVIKPALVGLTGPWISGGIEFNWPQHHRPSTFEPVDYSIEENADGSKTAWVNEVELMTRTKGRAGFTLHPGRAYLEVKVRLYNRTSFPQTFLWWANPAVKVNDEYQSIFPPDVHAVYDHGKRDVSDFPIATGTYYKMNYAPGTDISRYKNIPVPTSFMAVQSKYDFIGCYEHDTKAGMLHVADHHVVPGKKQWTWGNGHFGHAWDKNLTDEDGPYIELMCGAFTDNQPDFSWLQPGEEKSFEQYFMPYAGIGAVKNATKEAAVNLEFVPRACHVKVYTTAEYPQCRVTVMYREQELFSTVANISPAHMFEQIIPVDSYEESHHYRVDVMSANGKLLVSYTPEAPQHHDVPPPAVAAALPAAIASNELLYLNGLHLEQYRHATFRATDYYDEALRRDPNDIRCNNAKGLWLLRRAKFAEAEAHFRRAIERLTLRNPNPYVGEPYFNLGLSLKMRGRNDEAFDALQKSTWNDAMQHAAWLQLARIACERKDYPASLNFSIRSLSKNSGSHTAHHMKCIALRKLGCRDRLQESIEVALKMDPFNYGVRMEQIFSAPDAEQEKLRGQLQELMRGWFNNYVEYAIDYMHAGCYEEAVTLLKMYTDVTSSEKINPLAWYYLAYFHYRQDNVKAGSLMLEKATSANPAYCFPSKVEDVVVLQHALQQNATDDKAWYYLGNFWYANDQPQEAIQCWEKAVDIYDSFPTAYRNLALAYHNKQGQTSQALNGMERAFELDKSDARVLMELDQLYRLCNYPPEQRLRFLEEHLALVEQRDDLFLERIVLYNRLGEFDTARELLSQRKFHPWEGGEGKTVAQHLVSYTELAKLALSDGKYKQCLQLLDAAAAYPDNLGEGKLPGTQENDLNYLRGLCYEKMGLMNQADACFLLATKGVSEPVQAIFYNDPQPDKIVYQGLAWMKLGEENKAKNIFQRLVDFGREHMNDNISIDYFAVSLPDLLVFEQDLDHRNRVHCTYLQALGNLGLGEFEQANHLFHRVLEMDVNHQGAWIHRDMIQLLRRELNTT